LPDSEQIRQRVTAIPVLLSDCEIREPYTSATPADGWFRERSTGYPCPLTTITWNEKKRGTRPEPPTSTGKCSVRTNAAELVRRGHIGTAVIEESRSLQVRLPAKASEIQRRGPNPITWSSSRWRRHQWYHGHSLVVAACTGPAGDLQSPEGPWRSVNGVNEPTSHLLGGPRINHVCCPAWSPLGPGRAVALQGLLKTGAATVDSAGSRKRRQYRGPKLRASRASSVAAGVTRQRMPSRNTERSTARETASPT